LHVLFILEGQSRNLGNINDYVRAVEQALAQVPAGRRRELLAAMSERVQARRVQLREATYGEHALYERNDLLELFNGEVEEPGAVMVLPDPVALPASRRIGALAWLILLTVAVVLMCASATVTFAAFALQAALHK
jgi:hypothetical protein